MDKNNRLDSLIEERNQLFQANHRYIRYIREKVNQLLQVMGTLPLRPEELDNETLLDLDPIGTIANAFEQVLEYQNETNEELSTAKDELEAIFDATGVGISIIDRDLRILKCNEKQRILLVDDRNEDITGKYCYEVYCDKKSPVLDCPGIEIMETNKPLIVREIQKKGKYFQVATTPYKDINGNTVGVIEVMLDITGKKKAEKLLHQTEKLVSIGQLSAGISHELNTPLGSILGYARLLLRDDNIKPSQREKLEIIAEQAKKGGNIIKGLLDFARHSSLSSKKLIDSDLNVIIESAIKILSTEAEKRSIKIKKELPELPKIKTDPKQMEQVFINVLLNSIQAIGKDGIIRIRSLQKKKNVFIEIEDSGPGIPEDLKSRIFDPFFTTKPVGEGTGLGLSICAAFVNECGGSIDVRSAPGKGAAFIVTLPASEKRKMVNR